jgi:hypothetical protein
VAVFEGEALFSRAGELVIVEPGEQLVFSLEDEGVLKSAYFERDPWYRGLAALASGRGTVESFYGQVQLGEQGAWRDAALGDILTPGMSARTGERAWLELRFDDGNLIRLQAQSEITLKQLADYSDGSRRTVLELHRGSVWAVVETKGQPFEIETPGLVAGVRGTKLRLDAAENGRPPRLKVFEGVVVGMTDTWGESVQAGESFTPEEGVAALEPDSSDTFNLKLDEVPPEERDPSDLTPPPSEQAEYRAPPFSGDCPPLGSGEGEGPECERLPDPPADDLLDTPEVTGSEDGEQEDEVGAGQSGGCGQGENCDQPLDELPEPPDPPGPPEPPEPPDPPDGGDGEQEQEEEDEACAGRSEGRGQGRDANCEVPPETPRPPEDNKDRGHADDPEQGRPPEEEDCTPPLPPDDPDNENDHDEEKERSERERGPPGRP